MTSFPILHRAIRNFTGLHVLSCDNNTVYQDKLGAVRAYNINDIQAAERTRTNAKLAPLDPHHTHFILVNSGINDAGGEIEFRAQLEKHISLTGRADVPPTGNSQSQLLVS